MANKQGGFTLVEVMVSLLLVAVLLGTMASVIQNASTLNAKANLRAEASSLAFKKAQDYINLEFDDIPIGSGSTSYEIEDFSTEAASLNLNNVSAKVYAEPRSELPVASTTTTNYTQALSVSTAFVAGGEINSVDTDDATGKWSNDSRIRDNNYSNYTYSRYSASPDNIPSPSIDLGSSTLVDTIRVNWFYCGYGSSNFRIEAKDSSPNNNSGWTTIVSGLSDNGISCSYSSNPQDISVSSNTTPYRYWRLYFLDSEDSDYAVVSELEAFSSGTPADTVEQYGPTASSPGLLNFSSPTIDLTRDGSNGQQSIGMIFRDIHAPKSSIITNAYLSFTSDSNDSSAVTLIIKASNIDNASAWSGNYDVDKSVDNDNSDGKTGTSATVTWTPPSWSNGENGPDTQVNVSAIVQEIVNRAGWNTDNDIALTVQYVSGAGKRIAKKSAAPQLVINWSQSATTTAGNYVDNNSDGDVDNPTLLRVTTVIEYEAFNKPYKVEYATFIRKYGVGD